MRVCSSNRDLLPSGFAPVGGNLNPEVIRQIASGQRHRRVRDLIIGAGGDDFSPMFARTRAEIQNSVAGTHHIRIVFDHQHRISQIA